MEFQVTTDLAPVVNTQIETNFEAVKEWLSEELAPYATMVVTPETVADAKKTRASIRKVGDSIDSQRKAIKKEWMKPYEEYEAKCKELTGIVSEAVQNIDGQIKEMEAVEKAAKRGRLESFFNINTDDIRDYLSFDDLFDPKWLNSTFAETDAANIIMEKIEETREGLTAIRSMNSPYESAMLSEFARSHSLGRAIGEGKHLENIQKAEEERRAREAQKQEQEQPPAEPAVEHIPTTPIQPAVRPIVTDDAPKTYAYQFTMPSMTMEQMKALKRCLVENGIEFKAKKL